MWGLLNVEWQRSGRRRGLCYGGDSITPNVLIGFAIENCFQERGEPFDIEVDGINQGAKSDKVTEKIATASARRQQSSSGKVL